MDIQHRTMCKNIELANRKIKEAEANQNKPEKKESPVKETNAKKSK